MNDNLLILTGGDVQALLAGREGEIVQVVQAAYIAHGRGQSCLPHSSFVRFPQQPQNRIIALPAYLGSDFQVAGIKWIASFPGNHALHLDRASAVIVLNSLASGRPQAIMEGAQISAKRTAASAALAALHLKNGSAVPQVGLIGCGLINFEIARFLLTLCPEITTLVVYDLQPQSAQQFAERCAALLGARPVAVVIADRIETVLGECLLTSLATTALRPHVADVSLCRPGSTILHVSLRDFTAEALLAADNVVDDVDHVCRAETTIHLAEQQVGHRGFIRCTLADVLTGESPPRRTADGVTIFSPFGLGVLDVAVGQLVYRLAAAEGRGILIEDFYPR